MIAPAALVVALLAGLLAQAMAPSGNPARIEQLATPAEQHPAPKLPTGPDKPSQAANIVQLPTDLEPVAGDKEEALVPPPPPASAENRATVEVARAIGVIRGRGQQPTPELIAREVGPDVLDNYLAQLTNGAVAPVVQPGLTTPDPAKTPAGTTIIAPGTRP